MTLDLGFNCFVQLDQWLDFPKQIEPLQFSPIPKIDSQAAWMSHWVTHIPAQKNFYLALPRGLGYLGVLSAGHVSQPRPINYAGFFSVQEALPVSDINGGPDPVRAPIDKNLSLWIIDQRQCLWNLRYFESAQVIEPVSEWYLYQIQKPTATSEDIINRYMSANHFFLKLSDSILITIGLGIKNNFFTGFKFWDSVTHEVLLNTDSEQFVSSLLIYDSDLNTNCLGFINKLSGVYYRSHSWQIN